MLSPSTLNAHIVSPSTHLNTTRVLFSHSTHLNTDGKSTVLGGALAIFDRFLKGLQEENRAVGRQYKGVFAKIDTRNGSLSVRANLFNNVHFLFPNQNLTKKILRSQQRS
jgi:hypothetical protein